MGFRKIAVMTLGCVVACVAPAALADGIITTNPNLPPNMGSYLHAGPVDYNGPGLSIELTNIAHTPNVGSATSMDVGPNQFENFGSTATGDVSINGSPAIPFMLTGPVSIEVFGKVGNTLGTFNTQMLSMDLTGNVAGHSVEIKTDPTQASTGQTTIADNGGGTFHITSFFDVFTELSLDNGPFIPQSNGPAVVTLTTTPLPASIWGGLTLLVSFGGWSMVRRRARI